MTTLRSTILKALFHNSRGGTRTVPADIIVSNCQIAGYEEAEVHAELETLVEENVLREDSGGYTRVEETNPDSVDIVSYRGGTSMPWQFSVTLTGEEVDIKQARGPAERFDPVEKRYPIKDLVIGDEPVEFERSVIRRLWSEDPSRPEVQSQRSEARQVEFLYRDEDGWHLDHPEPSPETDGYESTRLPGVTVAASFIRSEDGSELKFTQDGAYRVTQEFPQSFEEAYVLSCFELNEESIENEFWEIRDATAYRVGSDI